MPRFYAKAAIRLAAIWFLTVATPFSVPLTLSRTLALRIVRPLGSQRNLILQSSNNSLSEIVQIDSSEENGDVNIPTTGISVSDEMEASQKDRFVTELIPISGLRDVVAQLVTSSSVSGSFEPVRYLVALSPPMVGNVTAVEDDNSEQLGRSVHTDFVIIDVPPFSPQLVYQIKEFVSANNGELRAILITSRDAIHYDEAPAVYSTRRADLELWCQAFSDLSIIAYRLDIPRDCRFAVTQVLDGYGPFALQTDGNSFEFLETGSPLSIAEWDHSVAQDVFCGKPPPDDADLEPAVKVNEADMYSPEAIRQREEGKCLLAVYTPGYSFGSVSYVFPNTGLCFSGFTVPIEDNRYDENLGIGGSTGPALDCRGFIAFSRDRRRQMESAKDLVNKYIDRFRVVLPSRGDPLFLDDNVEDRKELLLETIKQYEKIGAVYEQLGIISNDDNV